MPAGSICAPNMCRNQIVNTMCIVDVYKTENAESALIFCVLFCLHVFVRVRKIEINRKKSSGLPVPSGGGRERGFQIEK